jgi:hypothetical protein
LLISGVLGVLGFVPYILAILRGNAQPKKASWIPWGILNFIVFLGMMEKGAPLIQIGAITLGSWIVAGLSLKYGKPGWSKLDKFCLASAVLAIGAWKLLGDSNFGIGISLVGLFVSGLPTWESAWKTPEKENRAAWIMFATSSLLALLAISTFTMARAAQPIEFLLNQAVTVLLLLFRPYPARQSHVVLYRTDALNPKAADQIITEANRLLKNIPGVCSFHAAKVLNTGRAVGENYYDVLLNVVFVSMASYMNYMSHPRHLEFVKFVLNGYMLAGSRAADPQEEFINHILRGGEPRKWARNPVVPNNKVVWYDEIVVDAL